MRCQPNDWVYLTNERLGYTQKTFEVLSTNMEVIQDGDVPVIATRLELKEIEASVFNFATNDYTTGQAEGSDVSTGTYEVSPPSSLSLAQQNSIDGTTSKIDILASWTNNASDKVTLTEIAYKLSTDSDYTSDFTVGKRISNAAIPNVVVGKTYNVKIRHIDVNGVTSVYTSVSNITISVAGTAPATPSNLTVSTGRLNMLLSWTNPNSSDFRAVKVYRKTTNSTPTDDTDLVDTIGGEPNKVSTTLFGDQDGLTAGTTYYFWVRAINHSDLHSPFSSSVAGNFTKAVPDGTITELQLADEAVTNAKIAVNAIQGDVIAAGAITETKIASDAVTNAKIAIDAIQGDVIAAGAITEQKLGVDAVTSAKIADNAITSAQIAADAVTTAKIANDAITNALIATDAVNQDSIAANSVTATQIVAGTITATEIASSAITTAKIATGAITAGKIGAGEITATQIATDTITANNIASNAITANELDANSVTSEKINANAITTAKINAGAVTATKIATETITANELATNSISADKIQSNAITSAKILAGEITAGKLATDSVVASNIQANAVTTAKINAGAVTADKITVSTLSAITGNLGTLTAGTIDASQVTVSNLSASNISTGSLSAQRLILNGSTLTADGTGLKISTAGVNTIQLSDNSVTTYTASTGVKYYDYDGTYPNGSSSETRLGYAGSTGTLSTTSGAYSPAEAVMVETGIVRLPNVSNPIITVLAFCPNTVQANENSDAVYLRLQYRLASSSGGVSSASYSDIELRSITDATAEQNTGIQGIVPTSFAFASYYYQFRITLRAVGVDAPTGGSRTYGPATITAITTVK